MSIDEVKLKKYSTKKFFVFIIAILIVSSSDRVKSKVPYNIKQVIAHKMAYV